MKFIWVYVPSTFWTGNLTGRLVNPAEIETIVPEKHKGATIVFKSGQRLRVEHEAQDIAKSIKNGRERVFDED